MLEWGGRELVISFLPYQKLFFQIEIMQLKEVVKLNNNTVY